MKPIAIDLFCGAGGMSEGIIQAGFHIVFSNEISKDASLTYKTRHEQLGLIQGKNTWLETNDIKNISGEFIKEKIIQLNDFKNVKNIRIDAIFGGPPCQGFSRAGQQNTDDIRNFLFSEYLRVVNEVGPRYIVFENVPGILDIKFHNFVSIFDKEVYKEKSAIEIIKNELCKIQYNLLDYKILNASDYGVPQNRHRVILIGYKEGETPPNYPNKLEKKVSLREALSDITGYENNNLDYQIASRMGRTQNINTGIPISTEIYHNNDYSKHFKYIEERFSIFKEGESNNQLRKRILNEGLKIENYPNLMDYLINKTKLDRNEIIRKCKNLHNEIELVNLIITKKNSRLKLVLDKPGNTVLTLPDDLILPIHNRICTVREFARIQSFDDSFVFLGNRTTGGLERKKEVPQYSQVGNAVPPLLAKAIAEEIKKVL
ncbi:DNA (cytosine-5)-methyltransferase 1 [Fusobacterium sp. PH5-7]|uniref:DNA cytosine methyltransferase n=1 Tax=Fusobacterium sp. PH5-7 TaxID=2940528 RepID=UPI0024771B1D|nr:DNA cytosine methyltransferase [Fusobacterium sp. PH5-7]MDH6459632.1 DNA (cytosine-5)-methyltransferase 1 [Fusobacterium sp. PH5-7]